MSWDCTELSKVLKKNYGSKKITEGLIDSEKIKMIPWIAGAFVGGVAVTLGVQKIAKCLSKKEVIIVEELDIDNTEVVEDIKEDIKENIKEEDTKQETTEE